MLLAIDVGNTNTVFAIVDGSSIVCRWRCESRSRRTAEQYQAWLSVLLAAELPDSVITAATISSVVPGTVFNLEGMCRRFLGITPLVVGSEGCKLPVAVRVDRNTHVGSDRLVNTVAANDRYGGNLIVVDFGTATTFDVVDEDGGYAGGVIAPGVELSMEALHRAAAALPAIDVARPKSVVGRNTRDCMRSGIYWGYVSMIEGICRRIEAERGMPMRRIGTGGLAALLADPASSLYEVDADLTVHGLICIHNHNKKNFHD
ncbi:MAG: type III pantothenate kinase [Rhodobacteraceae bacterium]|nr:type III pantothenate kinase [Paracoccaceae bacterium]